MPLLQSDRMVFTWIFDIRHGDAIYTQILCYGIKSARQRHFNESSKERVNDPATHSSQIIKMQVNKVDEGPRLVTILLAVVFAIYFAVNYYISNRKKKEA